MKHRLHLLLTGAAWLCVAAQALAQDPASIYGAWDLTVETPDGPRPSWVKLFEENGVAVAEFVGATGGKSRAEGVKVEGDTFEWTIGRTTYRAALADGQLHGEMGRGERTTPLKGERVIRRTDVSGTWNTQLAVGDRTIDRIITLKQDGDQITGTITGGQLPQRQVADAKLDSDHLTFTITFSAGDRDVTAVYDLTVHGDRISGTTSLRDTEFQGNVQGTRQRSWGEPIELIRDDLSNWDFQQVGDANRWKIVDGVLVNEDRGWNIFTRDKFQDYKLRVEVKIPPRGNSGIYLNGRYEVQVADSHGDEVSEGGMGAIYGRAVPTANPSKPADEWQTFEITFVNYWATVVLNGTTIIDNVLLEGITGGALDSHESEPGPIMLQGDHGPIQYRNIVLTPLKTEG